MALSRERLRIAEDRYQIGNFSRLDMLQARVDFNADSSKYMSQQEAVIASRIRINELMANKSLDDKCVAKDSVIGVNDALKWDVLQAQMLESNVSLLIADRNTEISMLDLKAVKARNYPYLKLAAGYGYTLNRYGSGTTKTRGTLGPNVGLNLGFTIFDGNRRREQRNAKIEVENAQYTREQIELSLQADLATFWQAYLNNLEVVKLEQQNLITAKENYNIAMERYLLRELSGIDMREAQKSLLDAEERILTAEYNTKLCEISLMQISGGVLEYLK
jgi:outer membrane protein TolC